MASLSWVRAPGAEPCVGPRALVAAIERKLGREAITAPARADLAIEGHAERVGDGGPWRVTLALVGESGEVLGRRELGTGAPDCRALDDELALVIAVLIDPGAALATRTPPLPPPTAAPPPLPMPTAALPPLPPPVAQPPVCPPPPPPPAPWRGGGQAGIAGGLGLLPGVTGGLAVRARLTPPRWPSFEMGGAFWLPQTTGPVGADFSLAWGSLAVCPLEPERDGNRVRLCLGGVAGALRAEARGLSAPLVVEHLVLDVDAELRYERRLLGPLVASAGFGLLVPTIRDKYYYLDTTRQRRDVFRMTAVGGTAEVTLGIDLGR
jgi:hypothetical protein